MSDTSTADPSGFDPGRLRTAPTQMLRSRDDRYIAGVCGGLARYLNIDPVVVRVILAALTVVGGVGLVLYVAAWLLAPEEGAERNVLETHLPGSPRIRTLGWIVAGVLAVGAVVGSGPWFEWGWLGPFPLLGLAVLVWVLARPRHPGGTSLADPVAASPATDPPAAPTSSTATTTTTDGPTATTDAPTGTPTADDTITDDTEAPGSAATQPTRPAAHPPASTITAPLPPAPPRPYGPSPDRPNDRGALTWLTLAALLVVIGVLWLVDQSGTDLDGPVYLASSIAVLGVGMLVGTWWGNGRWLIPAGALLTVTLIGVSQLPVWKFGQITEAPTRSADVLSSYEMGAGQIELDLTAVEDISALDGRTIHLENGLGQIRVVVPQDLDVTVLAGLNAGNVEVFDRDANGADASTQYTDADDADPDVRIEIDGSLGNVEVIRS